MAADRGPLRLELSARSELAGVGLCELPYLSAVSVCQILDSTLSTTVIRQMMVGTTGASPGKAFMPGYVMLVVIYGDNVGKSYNLQGSVFLIGRSSKCDIQLDQESVSRNHSIVAHTGTSWVVRDLDTTNGTFVNDESIEDRVLANGDLIRVGRTVFKFLYPGSAEGLYHEEMHRLALLARSPFPPAPTNKDPIRGKGGTGS
jgi:hypothetical protein